MTAVSRPARMAKNAGEPPQNSECGYGLGRNEAAYAPIASTTPATASHLFSRDSPEGVRAASSRTPMHAPANTNPVHGKKQKLEKPDSGRKYASSASGARLSTGVERTTGAISASAAAVAANATIRGMRLRNMPQTTAAATIDGPMMFRMSIFSSVRGGPHPRIQAWIRNRNARRKIHAPRLMTPTAAAGSSPVRRAFDPADSATDTPARNRNSGAQNPATIIDKANPEVSRTSVRVQLSRT